MVNKDFQKYYNIKSVITIVSQYRQWNTCSMCPPFWSTTHRRRRSFGSCARYHCASPAVACNFSSWLPVKFRIVFKTGWLMHQILHNRRPLSVVSHRPGWVQVQHGGLTVSQRSTSAQVVTNQSGRRETDEDPLRQSWANAPSLSADLIHWTVFLQRSATSTVIQRSDELSSHICFVVLLLVNFYFIFYTYAHYLLTIVMHRRPSLYMTGH